jgi:transcriptional regulator with XRE-family HTH domain
MARDFRRLTTGFGNGLRQVRKTRGLTQEAFANVSGRTYVSALERGDRGNPTIQKLEELCELLECHPLTLLLISYGSEKRGENAKQLLKRIERELEDLEK